MNTRKQSWNTGSKIPLAMAAIALPVILLASGATAHSPANGQQRADQEQPGRHGDRSINLADLETRAKERFNSLDINTDNRISPEEFASAKRSDGDSKFRHMRDRKHRRAQHGKRHLNEDRELTAEQRAQFRDARQTELFSRLDTDENGQLSATEFASARQTRREFKRESRRTHRFNKLDINNDNWLTEDELMEKLNRLRALDSNADGRVDRSELRAGRAERRAQQQS